MIEIRISEKEGLFVFAGKFETLGDAMYPLLRCIGNRYRVSFRGDDSVLIDFDNGGGNEQASLTTDNLLYVVKKALTDWDVRVRNDGEPDNKWIDYYDRC